MGKRKGKKSDRPKIALVFDELKRKEFLCGFRKRKLERKKKAQEELQKMLKEEKKRIKQENKESYKKLVVSSRPLPDIDQLLKEEYEDEDVNVKIVELSSDTLQKRSLCIGENKAAQKETVSVKVKKPSKETDTLPGMGLEDPSEEEVEESDQEKEVKSKKEIKKLLKRQATKKMQKSKAFQIKNKLERIKNKKKSISKKGQINKIKQSKSKNRKVVKRKQ